MLVERADELRRTQRVVTLRAGALQVPSATRDDDAVRRLGETYGVASVLGRW